MLLPVTPQWQRGPGYWGSPFGRPHYVDLRHHQRGYRIPKGVWIIKCGSNRVEMVWRDCDAFRDEPRRFPGTEMIGPSWPKRPHRPKPPTRPPCPPPWRRYADPLAPPNWEPPWPKPGDNRLNREELVRPFSTGIVFADGASVVICGTGCATAIRVFG